MQNKTLYIYMIIGISVLILLFFISMSIGVYQLNLNDIKNLLLHPSSVSETDYYVFYGVRMPRTLLGIVMGAGFAISGASVQGMFKNPLATPGILGISSGAALFAAITIVLGSYIRPYIPTFLHYSLLSLAAFTGAILVMFSVYSISLKRGRTNIALLLLAGVAISALAGAITGLLTFVSTEEELRDLTFWGLGSLGGANWTKLIILSVITFIGIFFLVRNGKVLNAMMLGDQNAQHLGVNVKVHHKSIIWLASFIVGTSVAFAGSIGFIGLIVPYILRLLVKSDFRLILPLSAVYGAVLLLGSDILSRTIAEPKEVPIGIITAFMGAPIFIIILMRMKKSM